jgi:uncharacterized protein YggT (Ycf19 family)
VRVWIGIACCYLALLGLIAYLRNSWPPTVPKDKFASFLESCLLTLFPACGAVAQMCEPGSEEAYICYGGLALLADAIIYYIVLLVIREFIRRIRQSART